MKDGKNMPIDPSLSTIYLSVFAMLFCFWPCALVGLIYGIQVCGHNILLWLSQTYPRIFVGFSNWSLVGWLVESFTAPLIIMCMLNGVCNCVWIVCSACQGVWLSLSGYQVHYQLRLGSLDVVLFLEGSFIRACPGSISGNTRTHTTHTPQEMQEYYRGQYDQSTKTGKKAKRWVIASVVTGITFTVVVIVSVILIHAVTWGVIYSQDGKKG